MQRQRDLALAMVKGVPPYPATGNDDSTNFPSILGKRILPSQKGEQSRPAKKRSNVKFELPPPLPKKAVRKSAGAAVTPPKSKKPSGPPRKPERRAPQAKQEALYRQVRPPPNPLSPGVKGRKAIRQEDSERVDKRYSRNDDDWVLIAYADELLREPWENGWKICCARARRQLYR